jgi:CheY-like chemotaxis protein
MPVMDGFEFLEEYFELDFTGKPPVVVMLTTSLNVSDIKRVEALGVADYLNKPLLEEALKKIIAKYKM